MPDGFLPQGRLPAEVQQTIQARRANRALQPQAIVVVEKSFANTVTVTGEVVAGAQVPLSPGGDRQLDVIASDWERPAETPSSRYAEGLRHPGECQHIPGLCWIRT
jgi:hypothetical protein